MAFDAVGSFEDEKKLFSGVLSLGCGYRLSVNSLSCCDVGIVSSQFL